MLIEIKCSANLAKHAKDWLIETYNLINNLSKAYDIITSDRSSWLTEDLAAMGVSANEGLVYILDETVGSMELPRSYEVMKQGSYGSGMTVQKYLNAFTSIDYVLMTIKSKSDYAEPFTDEEVDTLKSMIYQSLGDLVYAFGRVLFDGRNPKTVYENLDEFTYSQDIQAFFAAIGKSAEETALYLIALQYKFIATIPLFENEPEEWAAITKGLDPALVDTLVDYGVYITSLDVRAFRLGVLTINENFVDLVCERAETQTHILNQAPVKWEQFITYIPDSEVAFFEENEFKITPEMLDVALKEKQLSPEYLETLHQLMGNVSGAKSTDVFK